MVGVSDKTRSPKKYSVNFGNWYEMQGMEYFSHIWINASRK